jgi:uroporphyrinogen III methyltransferase / synthase
VSCKRFLFPKADRARDLIPAELQKMGAEVTAPIAYRNVIPETLPAEALQALEERRIHCITFTSSSTARNLAAMLGENRLLNLLQGVAIASIGPVTSETCRELGLVVAIEPTEYTLAALTDEIIKYFSGNA